MDSRDFTDDTLVVVLRAVADAISVGNARPITVTTYSFSTPQVHLREEKDWRAWVSVFGGSPADAVTSDHKGSEHVTWSNESVSVLYIKEKS